MLFLTALVSIASVLGVSSSGDASQRQEGTVSLSFGIVSGTILEHTVEYLGIPYAAKPERFAAPQPWNQPFPGGRLDATKYSPTCVQPASPVPVPLPALANYSMMSEDCLYLNIFAPRSDQNTRPKLPVMLWIHGGDLKTGSAMTPYYNGSHLAQKENVIVVAINYRVNVFGFSATPLSDGSVLANNGFRDQREAMRWVRSQISQFGGNAKQITIFGQSAGGFSVATHVLSPGSKGLFDRAISESGPVAYFWPLNETVALMDVFATKVGCSNGSDLSCLRAVPEAIVMAVSQSMVQSHAWPVFGAIDGDVYPEAPLNLIRKGAFNNVPIMMGSNDDEGGLFVESFGLKSVSAENIRCMLRNSVGREKAEKLLVYYPVVDAFMADEPDNRRVYARIFGDWLFTCPTQQMALSLAERRANPFVYHFSREPFCKDFMVPGAAHGNEVPYVFGTAKSMFSNFPFNCSVPQEDQALSDLIESMWAGFARTGRPHKEWPRLSSADQRVLKLGLGSLLHMDTETGYRRAHCDLMKELNLPYNILQVLGLSLSKCQAAEDIVLV